MDRKSELTKLIPVDSLELVSQVIEDVIFLESKLTELKKLPFIQVHPTDPAVQRATPASKQYKEFLQQYINAIKVLEGVIYKDKRLEADEAEESPLRAWFKNYDDIK